MHLNSYKKFNSFVTNLLPLLAISVIVFVFFYPIFQGKIPFPGDLLVGEYVPYSTYPFIGYAPGGFPNKAQGFDILRFIYPAKEFSIETLKQFIIPLWNPYILSGNPHIGSLQSGTFYIFNFLFFIFDFKLAWTIYIILQPLLAGIFTYLLLREFKLQKISSLLGSISFSFSSYMVVWIEYGNLGHTIIWLPFVLWLVLKNMQKVTILKSVLLIFSLSASILAGYIQTTFYLYLFSLIFVSYLIIKTKVNEKKYAITFTLIFIFPVLLTLFQLLPTIELITQSVRPNYPYDEFIKLLIPKIHAITLFIPDFFGNPASRNYFLQGTYIERVSYIGIIPLLFVFYGLKKITNQKHLFFLISSIVVLLLAFDTYLAKVVYLTQLPFISTAVPTRIMFLFCFSISILAAFGYEKYINEKEKYINKPVMFVALTFALVWIFLFVLSVLSLSNFNQEYLSITSRNIILPSSIFILGLFILITSNINLKLKKYSHLIFFSLTLFELFYFFHKITPFSVSNAIYPSTQITNFIRKNQGINRTWGFGKARFDTNLQLHEGIFTTDGYEPLHNKRYGELLSTSKDGKIPQRLKGSIAEITTAGSNETLRDNPYRQKILNLLGVKYVLHINDSLNKEWKHDTRLFPQESYQLVWQEDVWQVYENVNSLPRFFLTDSYIVEDDKNAIIEKIYSQETGNKTLILEEKLPGGIILDKFSDSNVNLVIYTPNKSVFKVNTKSNSLFFLSDNFYPGWKATIDEQNAKIYRANYSFRALFVPPGLHEITFTYKPESFYWGLRLSILSFLGGIIFLVYLKFKKYV